MNEWVDDVKSEPREMNCIQEPGDYIDLLPHNLMGRSII